ncbi:hypothetical protein [Nostoc sp.]|uniref:hypothetical protein n=1 Tax=Nostoc sp. TaxID=1180 RepID=UPI002FF54C40
MTLSLRLVRVVDSPLPTDLFGLKASWFLFGRRCDSCIAGPATGGSLNVYLFSSIALPATGASCASNLCAGRQLKLTKTTRVVADSISLIFFNNLWSINSFQFNIVRMPN